MGRGERGRFTGPPRQTALATPRSHGPKTELRTFRVELRADGEGDGAPKTIVGYAAKFDRESQDLGGFKEVIRKGAFARAIKEDDVRALWNHDDNFVLGRNLSGTLKLEEDDTGLRIEIDPPDAQWARDLVTSIERGDVDQMSFAFRTIKDTWTRVDAEAGQPDVLRELLDVRLFDVSPVTYPAYLDTEVGVRQLVEGRDLTDQEREALRSILGDAGSDAGAPADGPARRSIDTLGRELQLSLA